MDTTRFEQLLERRTSATVEVTELGKSLNVTVTSGDELDVRELVLGMGKILKSVHRFDDGSTKFVFVSRFS
jgi:hypothetical protein